MYNSVQYSIKVWISFALAVPHIYMLYYGLNASGAFPVSGYIELLLLCVILSMPVWFVYLLTLDAICRTTLSNKFKKALGALSLEAFLLLVFTTVIALGGKRLSWFAYYDFIVICCFTAGICTTFFKLQPLQRKRVAV